VNDHLGALRRKEPDAGGADASGAAGDENAQTFESCFHGEAKKRFSIRRILMYCPGEG
jgi:hypothetical protein